MRRLLVWGTRDFTVTVPDDAKVTFGPWSPPTSSGSHYGAERGGTLRIYKGSKATENVIAVFSGVAGFRDLELGYDETTPVLSEPAAKASIPRWGSMKKAEREEMAEAVARAMARNALDSSIDKEDEDAS